MNSRISLTAVFFAFLSVQVVTSRGEDVISLRNHIMGIEFSCESGALRKLSDSKTGRNLLGEQFDDSHIWKIVLRQGDKSIGLDPSKADDFEYHKEDNTLALRWGKLGVEDAPDLVVAATVKLGGKDTDSRWNISVEGLGNLELAEVCFPRLTNVAIARNARLAVPIWMGRVTSSPRQIVYGKSGKPRRCAWEYPGHLSIQCLALYQPDDSGLYFACDDASAFRKSFRAYGSSRNDFSLEQAHLPEKTGDDSTAWRMPYDSLVGVMHGDWVTAAQRYRKWARKQKWSRESRRRRGLTPQWLLDLDLWVWNRGRSPGVVAPAIALKKHAGMPVGIFWHWWHGCSYDDGFPEYFPPREGKEPFMTAVRAAHRENIPSIVYMNQRLWGITTKSWTKENAQRFAVKNRAGELRRETYNIFTKKPCATMCMGTSFWRNKYAGLALRAVRELGLDGVYMDQACLSLACFDPSHNHPLGGGKYWVEGFAQMENDIRKRAGKNIVLAGEGCGEPWLPRLDLMLSLEVSRERYAGANIWETIPFFHAVYHSEALFFGNYSSLTSPPYDDLWPAEHAPKQPLELLDERFAQQFALEHARSFVWGQQLTLANFLPSHLEDRPREIEFVCRLARIRKNAAKYLRDGELIRPPRIPLPKIKIPMSRLSIYAGRKKGSVTAFEKKVPPAIACGWRAPDGCVAIAVAGIVDRKLKIPLDIDADDYGIRGKADLYRLDEKGRVGIGTYKPSDNPVKIQLEPWGACVIEIITAP